MLRSGKSEAKIVAELHPKLPQPCRVGAGLTPTAPTPRLCPLIRQLDEPLSTE